MKGEINTKAACKELRVKQKNLLKQIRGKESELRKHEKLIDKHQSREDFDYANDEKAEADGCALELLGFLKEAEDLEMNTRKFPRVQRLMNEFKRHFPSINPSGTCCE